AARTRKLAADDATVAKKAAEAAAAQARADAAKATLLRRRLGLEWGPAFMSMSEARRSALLGQIAAGRTALVRIDTAGNLGGGRDAMIDMGDDGRAAVTLLGPARVGDPRLQSTGLIGMVTGPAAALLGSGLSYPVTLTTGASASGVLLPRSA